MNRTDEPDRMMRNRDHDARDLQAVSEVLRGNSDAFADIVDRYQHIVRNLAYSYMGDRDDAEDAAQEAFLRVYQRLARYDLTQRFFPWMYTVAVNYMKSRRVKRNRRLAIELPVDTQSSEGRLLIDRPDESHRGLQLSAEGAALRKVDQNNIRQAVHSLPKKLRDPAVLYYLEERSVTEIAVALGIGRENVKSRLHRARKKLKDYLLDMQP